MYIRNNMTNKEKFKYSNNKFIRNNMINKRRV